MEATNSGYDHVASDTRIQQILNSSESFYEVKEIPPRSKLTYSNGYYVDCTALFIDIRDSSKLPENHNRPLPRAKNLQASKQAIANACGFHRNVLYNHAEAIAVLDKYASAEKLAIVS